MTVEEALAILDIALKPESLTDIQELVFRKVWEGLSYPDIADGAGYDPNYIKDVGSRLWKLVSNGLGEKVTKSNIQSVLRRQLPATQVAANTVAIPVNLPEIKADTLTVQAANNHQDWGDAADVSIFYGRNEEIAKLNQWIAKDRCRLIALLGMGGIGKTSIAVKLAEEIQHEFDYLIWRSLRNAPPVEDILGNLIEFVSDRQKIELAETTEGRISQLIELLRDRRCLLILDNAESIMGSGDRAGYYQAGYEGYGELFKRIGEVRHQSCLFLTSREKPKEFISLEGDTLPVRSLQLSGLKTTEGQEIFKIKGLFSGVESEWQTLVDRYVGNPLALKIVATTIQELFDGNISEFLAQGTVVFDDIRELLDRHFERLSTLEKDVMYWLAIERETVSLAQLRTDVIQPVSPSQLVENIGSLSRRSLIEKRLEQTAAVFTLQPVVMEYVTFRLIEQVAEEIGREQGREDERARGREGEKQGQRELLSKNNLFHTHSLIKAQAKDYIRDIQFRLILQPISDKLLIDFHSQANLENRLQNIVENLRSQSSIDQGYAAGNIINMLCLLKADLSKYDFSDLNVWQAYLRETNLHRVNFARANLAQSVFANTLSAVLSVAFNPDGQILATADVSNEVRLWRVTDGKELLVCQGHTNWVHTVAFNPSHGGILASGSADRTIRIWDTRTGECLKTLSGHTERIWSIAFSADGKHLVSGSGDRTIRIWDINTGECWRTIPGNAGGICSVALANNPQPIVAAGGEDGMVGIWDLDTGERLATFSGHAKWVWSVALSADGQILASGGDDRTIRLWNVRSGKLLQTLSGHTSRIWSVALSPIPPTPLDKGGVGASLPLGMGGIVASGSDDRTVKLWNVQTGECLRTLQGHSQWIWSVAFSPDGQTLASGGKDQTVHLWNVSSGSSLRTLQGYTNQIWSVAFSPFAQRSRREFPPTPLNKGGVGASLPSGIGGIVASGSDDRTIKLWNVETGECLKTLSGHARQVWVVNYSTDGKMLASGSDDQTAKLWDVSTGQCLKTLSGHSSRVWYAAFSPTEEILATGSGDRTVKLWDVSTGQCLKTLSGHDSRVWSVVFSPDGKTLASGSGDNTVKLWDVSTGECLKTLEGHLNWVFSTAFSPDGRILASGAGDRTVKLWNVQTGECLKTLQEQSKLMLSVTFSPDGQAIACGSDDHKIRLWDVESGECFKTLEGHMGWVWSVTFSTDGKTIASGSQDETIKIWEVETGRCLKTLRAPKPYEGMNITGAFGLTEATIFTLQALGAITDANAE
ncbi:MAG: AAA family ATPase [Cyanosarcina radialis HA8281-LM2]|jgi:WD40 repeat protein|nr:AAA family ATPase [Cyanosarcina radialis HA8281-LM2]